MSSYQKYPSTYVKTHDGELLAGYDAIIIRGKADLDTEGSVNMLNLVEGSAAVIESPAGGFEPCTVHYAETFILPAKAGPFTIRPANKDETIIVIRAYVRT